MRKRVALTVVVAAAAIGSPLGAAPALALPSEAVIYNKAGPPEDPYLVLYVAARFADGTAREIRFTRLEGSYVVSDADGIVPGDPPGAAGPPDCSQLDAETVSCPVSYGTVRLRQITVLTREGADLIDLRDTLEQTRAHAGPGADRVLTGARDGTLAHRVRSGRGADVLIGSVGRDNLDGGAGSDTIRTGGGQPFPRRFFAVNQVLGGSGADRIFGGPERDWILGHPGRDLMIGGDGEDEISGGKGNDTIRSRDGQRDGISCGPGNPARQHATRDRRERPLYKLRWPAGKPWSDHC